MATERPNRREPDEQDLALIEQFRDEGLLWLVNTAILHPRGYALGIEQDENGDAVRLILAGATDDYWYFEPGEFDEVIQHYEVAEKDRAHRFERAAFERLEERMRVRREQQ